METVSGEVLAGGEGSLRAKGSGMLDGSPHNFYHVECWRRPENCNCGGCQRWKSGRTFAIACEHRFLAWDDNIANIVVDEGANYLLTELLKGSSYTAAWYVGLISNTNFTALANSDTAAKITNSANPPTTNGWQEGTVYSNGARPTLAFGSVSARSVATSAASFNINGTDTIYGFFMATTSTISGTSGTIYGEAAFTQGTRSVVNGDTLSVTITCTA